MPYPPKHERRWELVVITTGRGRDTLIVARFSISFASPIERRDQIRNVARSRFGRDVHVDTHTGQIADPTTAEIVGDFTTTKYTNQQEPR